MTNETAMLKALLNGLKINPKFQPQNNKQAYLAYLCGLDIALPEPRTVEEILLCKLCADGGKYLHTMTIRTYLGKITMTLINNSAESLTRVYRENTDIFNGAILMIPAADIGQDEDFYATVIGYEYSGDVGILMIDKDFPFPVISSMPNVIDVISGEVIDNVSTKDGGKLEQEKKVEITKNGVTEIFPDEGYTLSRVVAIANVGGGENKLAQFINRSITELSEEDFGNANELLDDFASMQTNLISVEMPDTITQIGQWCFAYCNFLKNVKLPKNLIKCGSALFNHCHRLEKVIIPETLTEMPSSFGRNGAGYLSATGYFDVYIPDSIVDFKHNWFNKVADNTMEIPTQESLTRLYFASKDLFDRFIVSSASKTASTSAMCSNLKGFWFVDEEKVTSVTLPSSITQLGSHMFPKGLETKLDVICEGDITNVYVGACLGVKTLDLSKCTSVPIAQEDYWGKIVNKDWIEEIRVPTALYDEWISATTWANYAEYIVAV